MLVQTSVLRGSRTPWLRRLGLLAMGLVGVAVINIAGCPAPTYDQMFPGVTLEDIEDIRNSTTLTTEEQKTQALKDLGITDPQVLNILLNAPLPVTSTTG